MNRIGKSASIALGVAALATASATAQTPATNFAGEYEGTGNASGNTAKIVPTGTPNRYRVTINFGGMTAGGEYVSDQIEATGTARGNVLTVKKFTATQTCQMTFVTTGARRGYRLTGCNDANGWYRRTAPARR